MSFRLVPKSVTSNDLERRNGPYLSLFQRIRVRYRRLRIQLVYLCFAKLYSINEKRI